MKTLIQGLMAILILNFHCQTSKNPATSLDPLADFEKLSPYFASATTGIISAADPLQYVLQVPLQQMPDSAQLQKVIKLRPAVKGVVSMPRSNTIRFTPEENFKPNTEYRIDIDLNKLGSDVVQGSIDHTIRIKPQSMSVKLSGILLGEDEGYTILMTVHTADVARPELLKNCFPEWKDQLEIETIDLRQFSLSIPLTDLKKAPTKIQFDGKAIGSAQKGSIQLPELGTAQFSVWHFYTDTEAKIAYVYFSQPLDPAQDLSGLIRADQRFLNAEAIGNRLSIQLNTHRFETETTLYISPLLKSAKGAQLRQEIEYKIDLQLHLPDVQWYDQGNYIASKGDFLIPLKTRNLQSLKISVVEIPMDKIPHMLAWSELNYIGIYSVRMYGSLIHESKHLLQKTEEDESGWSIHLIDLSRHFQRNPGSAYFLSIDFGPADTDLSCTPELSKMSYNYKLPSEGFFKDKDAYFYEYDYYYYDYDYLESQNPCHISYYLSKSALQNLFLCTEYSIIAKRSSQQYHLWVSHLSDVSPAPDVQVSLYDLQGNLMGQGLTDKLGMVSIDSKYSAAVVKAQKGNSISFLSLDVYEAQSLTEFDVSGNRDETSLNFFNYTDRGVYRPGDSIFLNLMVRSEKKPLPEKLPLILRFFNPDNHLMAEQIQSYQAGRQIYSFFLHTSSADKTGIYRCELQIGQEILTKRIKVETIRPNVTTVLIQPKNLRKDVIYHPNLEGQLQVQYLTGFPVSNAQVIASANIVELQNPFPKYSDYRFAVKTQFYGSQLDLFTARADESGRASFRSDVSFKVFDGPAKISLDIETILPGGGLNKEGKTLLISPYHQYVGVKKQKGNGWGENYLTEESIPIELIRLSADGQPLSKRENLEITIDKNKHFWWVDRYALTHYGGYQSEYYWENHAIDQVAVTAKARIDLKKYIRSPGTYRCTVKDRASGHASAVYFTVYQSDKPIPGLEPHLFAVDADRTECVAGDTIRIKVPGVPKSKILVSIERGKEVLEQNLFDLEDRESSLAIVTKESWSPNVYAHMTIIQPYEQDLNELPLRMYAVLPIRVQSAEPNLQPEVKIPNRIESEKWYDIEISESRGRAMEYTVAVIDEGLLNLTGFKTPDPVAHFNGKYPLLVKSWDLYKHLQRYFRLKFAGRISIGGDDAYHPDAIPEISRFKPVVLHIPSTKIKAGEKKKHRIKLPNYIGKVRIMILACHGDLFGHWEKWVEVSNPLMIQSSFPRSLYAGDILDLPVNIFRKDASISNTTLSAVASPAWIKGFTPQHTLYFKDKDQLQHLYRLEVGDHIGPIQVKLKAQSNGYISEEKTPIEILNPVLPETQLKSVVIKPGESFEFAPDPKGIQELYSISYSISGRQLPHFDRFAKEIVQYPYGCLEQISSMGFAQLYLDKLIPLSEQMDKDRRLYLRSAIEQILALLNSKNQFNYWPNGYYDPWSDLYTGLFLIEARQLGYLKPNEQKALQNWISQQVKTANQWQLKSASTDYVRESESMIQAYRLYLLALAGNSAKSALNAISQRKDIQNPITWMHLAAAYALSGYPSKAETLRTSGEKLANTIENNFTYLNFGSSIRNTALLAALYTHLPNMAKKAVDMFEYLAQQIDRQKSLSTQTIGYTFFAAYQVLGNLAAQEQYVSYSIILPEGSQKAKHLAHEIRPYSVTPQQYGKNFTIKNDGKSDIYLQLQESFYPKNANQEAQSSNIDLQVRFRLKNGRSMPRMETIKLGEKVEFQIEIQNRSGVPQDFMALRIQAPSGFELINPALYVSAQIQDLNFMDYTEFRDNQISVFYKLKPGQKITLKYQARAAYSGDFVFPAILTENMYNPEIYARNSSSRVKVLP